jgi:NADPH-dependent 2,4-dienoyl-CoA reductase/sulfur reductase-like enzyme
MNCLDGIPGGIDTPEAIEIAGILAATGIDGLDITAGTYESSALTFPPMMYPEGHIMDRIRQIKQAVNVPVIGVGRVVRPETAERLVREGYVDYVALGRALIADPDWANKAASGRADEIRHCIGCNHGCIHRIDHDLSMRCNVNPDLGHEGRNRTPRAATPLRILVAGAGPAGVEFSVRAAKSGHDVHLCEATADVGGQLVLAEIPHFKKDLGTLRAYYNKRLALSGVRVSLQKAVTRDVVLEEQPDLVVIATGADPQTFSGTAPDPAPPMVTFDEVLAGTAELSDPVVIIGGGPNGCETAVFVAEQGHQVTLLELKRDLVADEDHSIKIWVADSFAEFGVSVHTGARVTSLGSDSVNFVNQGSDEESSVKAGTVVLASGMRPRRSLVAELDGLARVEVLGDAHRVASILEATERAAWLAERLGARDDL